MTKRPAGEDSGGGKRAKVDYSQIITVLVGKEKQSFVVHKDSICIKSKFFAAACSSRWAEGQDKTVHLPEQEPGRFQGYLHWVYSNETGLNRRPNTKDAATQSYEWHLELYSFADFLRDTTFANRIIDSLADLCAHYARNFDDCLIDIEQVANVYEHTVAGSPLRKLVVDYTLDQVCSKLFARCTDRYPQEFVRDLAGLAFQALQREHEVKGVEAQKERYHEPEDENAA